MIIIIHCTARWFDQMCQYRKPVSATHWLCQRYANAHSVDSLVITCDSPFGGKLKAMKWPLLTDSGHAAQYEPYRQARCERTDFVAGDSADSVRLVFDVIAFALRITPTYIRSVWYKNETSRRWKSPQQPQRSIEQQISRHLSSHGVPHSPLQTTFLCVIKNFTVFTLALKWTPDLWYMLCPAIKTPIW